jgi:5S rRNA maturation endonuclease (ribonuclease M5)
MITNNLSKEEILKLVSEEQIYKYYLGDNFSINKSILVPWREKINSIPSLNLFYSSNGTLLWKDHSYSEVGNVFQFVMKFNNCNYFEALKKIQYDIIINSNHNPGSLSNNQNNLRNIKRLPDINRKQEIKRIIHESKDWGIKDLTWWKDQGISRETLDLFNISNGDKVFYNGKLWLTSSIYNPIYIYSQDSTIKIYRPLMPKGKRFLGNMKNSTILGLNLIPDNYNELIILGKAYKDCASIWENNKIKSICKAGESCYWTTEDIERIKKKSTKLILLGDFDYTGVMIVNKAKRDFNLPYIFMSTNRHERRLDYTDSVLKNGIEFTVNKLNQLIK